MEREDNLYLQNVLSMSIIPTHTHSLVDCIDSHPHRKHQDVCVQVVWPGSFVSNTENKGHQLASLQHVR